MNFGRLRRHAHLFGAAPRDRTHIAVDDIIRRDHLLGGRRQIIHRGRHFETEDPCGV
jgi:hypothetical protein